MGFSHIRPLSLLLILAIMIIVFGTKRLRTLGKDLGLALKDFRESMSDDAADQITHHSRKEHESN